MQLVSHLFLAKRRCRPRLGRIALGQLIVLLTSLSPMVATASLCLEPPGDVTGNGTVNVADVQCVNLTVLWGLAGSSGPAPACLAHPAAFTDINCDAQVTVGDTQALLLLVLDGALPAGLDSDGNGCADACEKTPLELGDVIGPPVVFTGAASSASFGLQALSPWMAAPSATGGIFTGNTVRSQLTPAPSPASE